MRGIILIIKIITIGCLDSNVTKTLIIFTVEKISRYTLIHSIADGAGIGNQGIVYAELGIWLIEIMFVCVYTCGCLEAIIFSA